MDDPAERLVPKHQPRSAWRRPAVLAFDDFDVGSAHADGNGFDEDGPLVLIGLGDVFEAGSPGPARFDGHGLHGGSSVSRVERDRQMLVETAILLQLGCGRA
jgi:hypothetical protein